MGQRAVVEWFSFGFCEGGGERVEGVEGDAVEVGAGVGGFAVCAAEGFGGWDVVEGGGGEGLD